jgi:hypothetical protein
VAWRCGQADPAAKRMTPRSPRKRSAGPDRPL